MKRKLTALLLSLIMIFGCFCQSASAAGAGDGKGIIAYGIDVSSWQGTAVDWVKVKNSGIDFAILRCATTNIVDKAFETNYKNAKAAGVDLGCYIYTYSTTVTGAKKDAEKVLELIKGKQFEYPIYFDIEDESLNGLSRTKRTDMCLAFCDILSQNGWMTGVYASKAYLRDMLYSDKIGEKYELWMALWPKDGKPDTDYSASYGMWQYSESGKVSGVPYYADMDVAYKNYPKLIREQGLNGYKNQTYKMGDCDLDGVLTSNDSLMILKYSLGLIKMSDKQKSLADADGDKKITSNDALLVLKKSLGIVK